MNASTDSVPPFPGEPWFADEVLTHGVIVRRCVAWVLDAIIILGLYGMLWLLLAAFGIMTLGLGLPLLHLLPFMPFLYTWLFVASPASATPGQAMTGLAVRRNDDLERPTPLQALIYTAGWYVTIALGAIWLLVALLTLRNRAIHDLVAGVVIVRKQALTQGPAVWESSRGGTPFA